MTINPLQFSTQTIPSGTTGPARPETGGSPFAEILGSLSSSAGPTAAQQRAAAELMRIQLMQHSLALFGDENPTAAAPIPPWQPFLAGPPEFRPPASAPQASATAATSSVASPDIAASEADAIGATAANYLGTPYRFGGEGADGIDCSSFVQHVFRENRIDLPRTAREQSQVGSDVPQGELRKGDLVFFHTYASYPSHVGIYLGDGKMIHASSVKGEVTISDMTGAYYQSRFMGARRIA